METIKNYLNNMFQTLPETEEILRLKGELLGDMEAKYHELRQSGKTENEAIGTVIAEFGNIDELFHEMGIVVTEKETSDVLSMEDVREFLSLTSKTSITTGAGVAIILFGVSLFFWFPGLLDKGIMFRFWSDNVNSNLSVILLLVLIIPAVGLFIYSGTLMEKFKFIEAGDFVMTANTKAILEEEFAASLPKYNLSVIMGVSLCIFSVIPLLVLSAISDYFAIYGVCLLIMFVAVAVFIFIRFGSTHNAYKQLLKRDDFAPSKRHDNKIVAGIASIVWPIAISIFFVWGLVFDGWGISWIVFPITGILFGGVSTMLGGGEKK